MTTPLLVGFALTSSSFVSAVSAANRRLRPPPAITGWINSVAYVSGLSLWALVSGHWSAWQAARVEVEQQREIQEREENPTEQRVVDELVKQTTLEPAAASPLTQGDSSQ